MVQIYRCDVCKIIGEPGVQWIRFNLMPFTIPQSGSSTDVECVAYDNLYLDACSINCIRERLIDFDFVVITHNSMAEVAQPAPW